jgi:hypothetical protein
MVPEWSRNSYKRNDHLIPPMYIGCFYVNNCQQTKDSNMSSKNWLYESLNMYILLLIGNMLQDQLTCQANTILIKIGIS